MSFKYFSFIRNNELILRIILLSRAQVVGWPPIRSYRKSMMPTNLDKNKGGTEDKQSFGCVFVKVSMDGAPYLRKVDLKTYGNYKELSSALEKMFSCFTIGEICLYLNRFNFICFTVEVADFWHQSFVRKVILSLKLLILLIFFCLIFLFYDKLSVMRNEFLIL